MYIRKSIRTYKGKTYTNYVLVESVVTPNGPRQKTSCSLGDLSPRPREEWLELARKMEGALIKVDPSRVTTEQHREAGPVHVGYQFWQRLGLDQILRDCGLSAVVCRLACVMTLNRLIAPASEHAMPAWIRRTALADILGE